MLRVRSSKTRLLVPPLLHYNLNIQLKMDWKTLQTLTGLEIGINGYGNGNWFANMINVIHVNQISDMLFNDATNSSAWHTNELMEEIAVSCVSMHSTALHSRQGALFFSLFPFEQRNHKFFSFSFPLFFFVFFKRIAWAFQWRAINLSFWSIEVFIWNWLCDSDFDFGITFSIQHVARGL